MSESYSVRAKLSAQDSGFTSTMNKAKASIKGLGSQIKSGFAFGVLTGAGQAAFNTITNSVTGLISEVNSSNASWKTFTKNMQMVGKSEKEIAKVKGELQDFAQKTVYSSSDMATTFAQLEAVGVKNTTSLVKGFGGLAAAAENPQQAMKTLSTQATQMAAKPTVAWADFKLMLEQSPAGIAAVAKEMGMTTSELVKNVQDGEIATDKFFDAIAKVGTNKAFTELATEAKTVGQAMDGLKETIGTKLTPAFEVLNKKGISIINKLADKLSKINADALAKKVESAVNKISKYFTALREAFSGVGTEIWGAVKEIGAALTGMTGEFGSTESINGFKEVMKSVANAIKSVAQFCKKHAGAIATFIKWLPALVIGIKALKIASAVAPAVTAFAKGLGGLVSKGIGGIATKLFGISKSQKAVGSASVTSGAQMLTSAKSFALMGVAVLAIAAGFALLAFSAISLANAGGAAIAVMAGLLVALVALGIGMVVLLKTLAPMSGQMMPVAVAMLALGAAVLFIGAGFALLAVASIALANAGGAAIAVMVGMIAVLALMAIGAAAISAPLMYGAIAVGLFGAALLICATAAVLAATSLLIISKALPTLVEYGVSGAAAIILISSAMLVFAGSALTAGAAAIVLGAGLALAAVGILTAAAGISIIAISIAIIGSNALIAATSISIMAKMLPILTKNSVANALALSILAGGLLVLGTAAGIAGIGFIALGTGLAVTAVGILSVAIAVAALAAGIMLLSANAAASAVAITLISNALSLLVEKSASGAAALIVLGVALTIFSVGALAAGMAAVVLGTGLTVVATALILAAAGMAVLAVALVSVNTRMKSIASNAKIAEESLTSMRNSVKAVESGLSALGSIVKAAMKKLMNSFDEAAGKVESAGRKLGNSFIKGLKSELAQAKVVAALTILEVNTTLISGADGAYEAGAFVSKGFANGMRAFLGTIKAAAAEMAAAADEAIRAKAKIHSPSKVTTEAGEDFAKGWINGIASKIKEACSVTESLFSTPAINTPDLAMAYSGELSSDYEYSRNAEYVIEVPLAVDGKEFARATATYTQAELDKRQTRDNRKHGKI